MSKITLDNVGNLIDVTSAQSTINDNFDTVEVAFDNTLSRDGTAPNQMGAPLDMNGQQVLNLPFPATENSPLRFADLVEFNDTGVITNLPTGGTTGQPLAKTSNADYAVGWEPITGTGNFVKSTSPTLVTPNLGTPSAVTLTNATGLPLAGVTGVNSNAAIFLGTPTSATLAGALSDETGTGSAVFATSPTITSPTLVTPALGTPSSGNLVNCTGVSVGGISGLGTGVATFLGTPSSANLAAAVTGETGTGALVFGTTPTIATPAISNPTITSGGSWAGSPTINTPNITGITGGTNATAGSVGEYIISYLVVGSAVGLTTGSPTNVTSIVLTAGDWDVTGNVFFNPATTTSITRYGGSIETVSGAFSSVPTQTSVISSAAFVPGTGAVIGVPTPIFRQNVTGSTTIYLTAVAVFTVSTLSAFGFISARRIR